MYSLWQRLLRDSSGVSIVEYGVIVFMISIGMMLALGRVGGGMQNIYVAVNNATTNALALTGP